MHVSTVMLASSKKSVPLPLLLHRVPAGFPSPADDFMASALDLNEHLIQHPQATYFVRVSGESMVDAAIYSGDILVVDRSIRPVHDKIVIAAVNGELLVKRLYKRNGRHALISENKTYPPITLDPESEVVIWGVVTFIIHQAR